MEVKKPKKPKKPKRCAKKGCYAELDLANRHECKYCRKVFCLGHRYDFAHSCSKMPLPSKCSDEWRAIEARRANEVAFNWLTKELLNEGK